jgi:hypothetical protein
LAESSSPLRYDEIRASMEERLGMSVSLSSVKQFLSVESHHRRPRFVRIGRGRYQALSSDQA